MPPSPYGGGITKIICKQNKIQGSISTYAHEDSVKVWLDSMQWFRRSSGLEKCGDDADSDDNDNAR